MFQVALQRDGQGTAWGFRLQGGADHSRPLQVQRVCIGSPSEGNLQRGDTILKIGAQDTNQLTHQDAHDIIKHTGNVLHLTVQRTGADLPPTTPSPLPNLSLLISDAAHHTASPLASPTPSGLPYHTVLQHPMDYLPVSKPIMSPKPPISPRPPPPEIDEKEEKDAIQHQPYRTTPLITPSLKVKRDTPVGSYLRYQPKGLGISASQMDSVMKERVLDSVTSAASGQGINPQSYQPPQPMSRLPTTIQPPVPDLPPIVQHPSPIPGEGERQVVNLQYNSPAGLYSQPNIAKAVEDQTGLTPEPGLPKVYSPQKSYTFNAVADEEWGNLHKKSFEEKRPPPQKIKTAPQHQKDSSTGTGIPVLVQASRSLSQKGLVCPRPVVGGMGMATEKIAQSGTFMRLMHEVGI